MNQLWNELADRGGTVVDEQREHLLNRYLDLLLEANERMNLTGITERKAAEAGHVGDALTLLPFLKKEAHRLADVGSGGGVPGLPLAIVRPDVSVTLIESTKKKAVFLREAIQSLGLLNVNVLDVRAEDLARGKGRETFDIVVARAVATLDWLAEWCLPLVKKGGYVLAMKGQKAGEEVMKAQSVIKKLGGGEARTHGVALPGSEHRVIIEIPKTGKTPPQFPRASTEGKRTPIG